MEKDISKHRVVNTRLIVPSIREFLIIIVLLTGLIAPTMAQLEIPKPDTVAVEDWQKWTASEQTKYLDHWEEMTQNYFTELESQLQQNLQELQRASENKLNELVNRKKSMLDSLQQDFGARFDALSLQEEQSFYKEKKFRARDELQAKYDQALNEFQEAWAQKEKDMHNQLDELKDSKTKLLNEILSSNMMWLEQYRERLISTQKHS